MTLPRSQHEYTGDSVSFYEKLRVGDRKWVRENQVIEGLLLRYVDETSVVLDCPVGTGRFLPLYAERRCAVFGIDISADMLKEAQIRAGGNANVSLQGGDILNMPLPAKSVDFAVCVRFANLVPLPVLESALKELCRTTRGRIVLGVRVHRRTGVARRTLRRCLELSGVRTAKLVIHSDEAVDRLLSRCGLRSSERHLIAVGKDGTSEYHIHVLEFGLE